MCWVILDSHQCTEHNQHIANCANIFRDKAQRLELQLGEAMQLLNEAHVFYCVENCGPAEHKPKCLQITAFIGTEKRKCEHQRTEPAGDDMVRVCLDCKTRVL